MITVNGANSTSPATMSASRNQRQPPLLCLPQELRDVIYAYILIEDVEHFAETAQLPALLSVHPQIRHEYSARFYATPLLTLDAYYHATDSWCEIRGTAAKCAILERSHFTDLSMFWSLASARRYCQRGGIALGLEALGKGIVTVRTQAGTRRWLWTEGEG